MNPESGKPHEEAEMAPEMKKALVAFGKYILTTYGREEEIGKEVTYRGVTILPEEFLVHASYRDDVLGLLARRKELPTGDPERENIDSIFLGYMSDIFDPKPEK